MYVYIIFLCKLEMTESFNPIIIALPIISFNYNLVIVMKAIAATNYIVLLSTMFITFDFYCI